MAACAIARGSWALWRSAQAATGAELQAALLMNAGDHRPPRRAAALGFTPAALGHRRWPASRPQVLGGERRRRAPAADGSLVNAFARAGRWHGVHSRPPQASGSQGDAGSCDPNWGQSVSPPPPRSRGRARRPAAAGLGGTTETGRGHWRRGATAGVSQGSHPSRRRIGPRSR